MLPEYPLERRDASRTCTAHDVSARVRSSRRLLGGECRSFEVAAESAAATRRTRNIRDDRSQGARTLNSTAHSRVDSLCCLRVAARPFSHQNVRHRSPVDMPAQWPMPRPAVREQQTARAANRIPSLGSLQVTKRRLRLGNAGTRRDSQARWKRLDSPVLCADTASHSAPTGARETTWKQKEVLLPFCKEASRHRAVWNTSYAREGVAPSCFWCCGHWSRRSPL